MNIVHESALTWVSLTLNRPQSLGWSKFFPRLLLMWRNKSFMHTSCNSIDHVNVNIYWPWGMSLVKYSSSSKWASPPNSGKNAWASTLPGPSKANPSPCSPRTNLMSISATWLLSTFWNVRPLFSSQRSKARLISPSVWDPRSSLKFWNLYVRSFFCQTEPVSEEKRHTEAWTKLTIFCWHFQMHFLEAIDFYFDTNFIEVLLRVQLSVNHDWFR